MISALISNIFFICAVAITLLHDYYENKFDKTVIIVQKIPQFKLLYPKSEVSKCRFNLNYSKLIDIDFKFKILPNICDGSFLVVIVVSSNLNQFEHRQAIRQTWGKANDAVRVVFAVGINNDKEIARKITFESNIFKDILQGNFVDTYRNLTYKSMMVLKWVVHHCWTAKYLLKADDDVFINMSEMNKFLVRELSPWGAQKLIGCAVCWNRYVDRGWQGMTKWSVTKDEYQGDSYPNYCRGAAIVFSKDVLPFLLKASESTKYFHLEDIYVTGILAHNASIPRTDTSYQHFDEYRLRMNLKWGVKKSPLIVAPNNLNPNEIRETWHLMTGTKMMSYEIDKGWKLLKEFGLKLK